VTRHGDEMSSYIAARNIALRVMHRKTAENARDEAEGNCFVMEHDCRERIVHNVVD
jgi:hypothetical protein